MHALVIGGSRFVGRLVVGRLLARGDRVTILNRGVTPDPFGDRVERLRGDRTKGELDRLVRGRSFDVAFDFTAYVGAEVEEAVRALTVGHYIFISTGQVYLVREGCPRPSREEDYEGRVMARPSDPDELPQWEYGAGKRDCEDALVRARGFPSTRIRIPVVNGEGDSSGRLDGYLWRLLDGGPVILPDGGEHRVRHVYGVDVARALVALAGDARTHGKAYNLANDETPTLLELVALLARELGAPSPRTLAVPSSELRARGLVPRRISAFSSPWQSFLDPSRARSELGFVATALGHQARSIVASFLAHAPHPPEEYAVDRPKELEVAH
jgi:nucleoside-diphosphate-sugar epimerase